MISFDGSYFLSLSRSIKNMKENLQKKITKERILFIISIGKFYFGGHDL